MISNNIIRIYHQVFTSHIGKNKLTNVTINDSRPNDYYFFGQNY
jgi:hypothetical protein